MTTTFGQDVVKELKHVARYAQALTHNVNDAEDLVQDCVVKALSNEHLFVKGNLRGWLIRITHNEFMNKVRKKKIVTETIDTECQVFVKEVAIVNVYVKEVVESLKKLPSPYREAVVKHTIDGDDYVNSATSLQIPLGTFRSRTWRGRAMLREVLDGVNRPSYKALGRRRENGACL